VARAQLIITAVAVEGRSKTEVAREYGVSRYWVQQLVSRYRCEGPAAFQPRSRRPHYSPHAVDADTEDAIIQLRKELSKQGLDAGAETIAAHLVGCEPVESGRPGPAVSTIWRILSRRGFVTPQPQKRPRSSWRTFCAEQPNERWQADITHWQLADGTEISILNIVDDHSRLCVGSDAHRHTTGSAVVASFRRCSDSQRRGESARCAALVQPKQRKRRSKYSQMRPKMRPRPRTPAPTLWRGQRFALSAGGGGGI
jgi:transposase-like protein